MTFVIPFPNIDPVLISFGPFAIRWYALAYIGGLLISWRLMRRLVLRSPEAATLEDVDDFLVWATLGVVFGGRIGYVLFYNAAYYLEHPLSILAVWRGGMSFHGGLLGVVVAVVVFCRRRRIPLLAFSDRLACVTPIGLFLGRVANFINGELFGRVADVPWAVVFPRGGPHSRHPSQLYEAFAEGALLFVVLMWLVRDERLRRRPGLLTGVFLAGYGAVRMISELYRQPDAHIGFLGFGTTMGQWLSLPLVIGGLYLIHRAGRDAAAG
jgi:phosphatidylglycerol---prolipoprotein diacylglyceryl transferase